MTAQHVKTWLVVGAGGFVGRNLVSHLRERGERVRALSRSFDDRDPLWAGVECIVADCADVQAVSKAVRGVDAVVYAAGGLLPAGSSSAVVQDVRLALSPLVTLLDAMVHQPTPPKLCFLSSGGTVYGDPAYLLIDEAHPTEPTTSYGILKLTAEKYISMYGRRHGVDIVVLRCANIYGPGQSAHRGQGAVASFMDRIRRDVPVTVYGDGSIVRDYVHVWDVVDLIRRVTVRTSGHDVFNVGSERGTTLIELIEAIEVVVGRTARVECCPARRFDVKSNVLATDRLRAAVAWEPRSLHDGLLTLVDRGEPSLSISLT